jgi:hypothetical protein
MCSWLCRQLQRQTVKGVIEGVADILSGFYADNVLPYSVRSVQWVLDWIVWWWVFGTCTGHHNDHMLYAVAAAAPRRVAPPLPPQVGAKYVVLPKTLDYTPISTTQILANIRAPSTCPLRVDFGGGEPPHTSIPQVVMLLIPITGIPL